MTILPTFRKSTSLGFRVLGCVKAQSILQGYGHGEGDGDGCSVAASPIVPALSSEGTRLAARNVFLLEWTELDIGFWGAICSLIARGCSLAVAGFGWEYW